MLSSSEYSRVRIFGVRRVSDAGVQGRFPDLVMKNDCLYLLGNIVDPLGYRSICTMPLLGENTIVALAPMLKSEPSQR